MKNYENVIKNFAKLLNKHNWPKTIFVTPGVYWDVIIASEGKIEPDWHFHPTGEDEGYPFFILGPTMVRVDSERANQLALKTFKEIEDERIESEEPTESGVRGAEDLDPGGVFPLPSAPTPVHDSEDVPEDRPEDDSSGPGRRDAEGDREQR